MNPKPKAIVLIHLGTPRDFSEAAARDFLKEFLGDPDVIGMPSLLRKILVGRIAKRRSAAFAENLRRLSVNGVMQLDYYADGLARKLEDLTKVRVLTAGAYGDCRVEKVLAGASLSKEDGVVFIPLYPQYSTATTLPVEKRILALGFSAECIVKSYFNEPLYIEALADSVAPFIGKFERLVGSFHGLPLSSPGVKEYMRECGESLRLLCAKAGIEKYGLAWQSVMKFGKWTSPRIEDEIAGLARGGVKRIAAICPGFFCECLETSAEIENDLRKTFLESGGESFVYIRCLNDTDAHARLMEKIYNERVSGQ